MTNRQSLLRYEFVEYMPEDLEEGVLHVSLTFRTAGHRCCCGCRGLVVTPLSPTDWQLGFDGVSISLYPSIGNWNFPCKSHYWIARNTVRWAPQWPASEIATGRVYDSAFKNRYYADRREPPEQRPAPTHPWSRLWDWLSRDPDT